MTIFDYFTAQAVAIYWTEVQDALPPYLLNYFFPDERIESDDFSYIKGADSTPIALSMSSYDADPTFRDLEGFTEYTGKLAFFREGFLVKEKDRRELMRAVANNEQNIINSLLSKLYKQASKLIIGAASVREVFRSQLLLDGKVDFEGNGCHFIADYKMDSKQKITATTKWTSAAATPLADMRKWKKEADKRNHQDNRIFIMNSETFDPLYTNAEILEIFKVNQNLPVIEDDLVDLIQRKLKIQIVFYNKTYKLKGKAETPFIPVGRIVILPDTQIGSTYFAPTPEESDLMYNPNFSGSVEIVDTGVAVTSIVANDIPVRLETVVSQAMAPSFELGEYVTTVSGLA